MCTISGLTVTSKNYTFVPVAPDPNAVTTLEIVRSRITVLTSNICTTLNKIEQFAAIGQHIEMVENYAFSNCTNVMEIYLDNNNIHKLGVGIFSNTKQLTTLRILGGSLYNIDVDLFSSLGKLETLVFSATGLKKLPAEAMKNLKKLTILYIYSNSLVDLDAKGLVENLPSLAEIYLNDNDFRCDRLIEIIEIFQANAILVNDHLHSNTIKRRDYIPRTIDKITCLSQGQQDIEKFKGALTDSLDDLKDLPTGKAVIPQNNLLKNTDSINEMKTIHKELDQNMKESAAVQQQLVQKLGDNAAAQRQLKEKLKDNSAATTLTKASRRGGIILETR